MIYIILVLSIVLLGVSARKSSGFLDMDSTNAIRGFAMVIIFLHHIMNRVGYLPYLQVLASSGYICTGIFFFLSGYGNLLSLKRQTVLEAKWLKKRLVPLYSVFFVFYVIRSIGFVILNNMGLYSFNVTFLKIIKELCTLTTPDGINWFPKIIFISFILYYLIYKYIKNDNVKLLVLFLIISAYIVGGYVCHLPTYWYNSVFCFFVGAFVGKYKETISKYISETPTVNKILLFVVNMILFCVSFLLLRGRTIFQIIPCVLASLLCVTTLNVVNFKTKLLSYVGKNSFEFYITHVSMLAILYAFSTDTNVLTISLFVVSVLLVWAYLFFKNMVIMKRHNDFQSKRIVNQ